MDAVGKGNVATSVGSITGIGTAADETALTIPAAITFVINSTGNTLTISAGEVNVLGGLEIPNGKVVAITSGKLIIGDAVNNVKLTNATLTSASSTGIEANGTAGTLELTAGDKIALADTGTIVVEAPAIGATANVTLPNTVFGAGTYAATGAVTITAIAAGDEIDTVAGTGKGLKFYIGAVTSNDSIALTSTGDGNPAKYKFDKNDATSKIAFGSYTVASNVYAGIAIPGAASTQTGADVLMDANGTIVIGQGTNGGAIALVGGSDVSGSLTVVTGSVIKGMTVSKTGSGNSYPIAITGIATSNTSTASLSTGTDGVLPIGTTAGTFGLTTPAGSDVLLKKDTAVVVTGS
jgi:hypothetical protein